MKVDSNHTPYNPEFVAKIEKSIQEAKDGKVVKFELDDIYKLDELNSTAAELKLMKNGLKKALLIKEGKTKSIPFSELWS